MDGHQWCYTTFTLFTRSRKLQTLLQPADYDSWGKDIKKYKDIKSLLLAILGQKTSLNEERDGILTVVAIPSLAVAVNSALDPKSSSPCCVMQHGGLLIRNQWLQRLLLVANKSLATSSRQITIVGGKQEQLWRFWHYVYTYFKSLHNIWDLFVPLIFKE